MAEHFRNIIALLFACFRPTFLLSGRRLRRLWTTLPRQYVITFTDAGVGYETLSTPTV